VHGGRAGDQPYRPVPRLTLQPSPERQHLAVLAAFAEVHLAKQAARGARVGINFLEKIQLETPAATYGAMLAGVDVILVGAGIPARLPSLINALSRHLRAEFPIDVAGAGQARHALVFDPVALLGRRLAVLLRPLFLAVVSSTTLASFLARDDKTRPDGFVVEAAIAGGHNAPPRGALHLDEQGEPVYGPRDVADPASFVALGLPFWLAGGYSQPERIVAARAAGANGVQVGTLFALSRESGLSAPLRQQLLDQLRERQLAVRTDALASPTGFPFKVAQLAGTLSDPSVYERRRRVCDLSYLRTPYVGPDGAIGYRCPAEPADAYVRKGGDRSETVGRVCLCNALTATVGLGQYRRGGTAEPPVVTLGADLDGARELLRRHPEGWGANDVIAYLTGS
jgi:NAD(P)H-dependent flavin oxidoreductase YrpB (nitropropane dioxygenase family)